MDIINRGAPKLSVSKSKSISLCENDTVAFNTLNSVENFGQPLSAGILPLIAAEKSLEPFEVFAIDIEGKNNEDFNERNNRLVYFHHSLRLLSSPHHLNTMEELRSSYSDNYLMREYFSRLEGMCNSNKHRTSYARVLLDILDRHFLISADKNSLNNMPTNRIGLFYFKISDYYFEFHTLSRNHITVENIYQSCTEKIYVKFNIDNCIKQIRTISLYDMPSLQSFCYEAILDQLIANKKLKKENLQKLALPAYMIEKLMLRAKWKATESCNEQRNERLRQWNLL